MHEKYLLPPQPVYLLKIISGLIVIAGLIAAAFGLSVSGLPPFARNLWLGALLLVAAAIVPLVGRVYRKMDEMQKHQHQNACVASLPLIAAVSAILGMLQFNGLLPAFNQFWMFGLVVGVWAINLMLADRRFR